MAGNRSALIVASDRYRDPGLKQLRSPAYDAESLAGVLQDPAIGNFDVQLVVNEPEPILRRQVADFFSDRSLEDVLLLHFACHGVKDADGQLYFAAPDTEVQALDATALPSEFVSRQMTKSRSRRIILLLDCCYSGAFARGLVARADKSVDIKDQLGGQGRVVITASSAMEYAFEGDSLTNSAGTPSIFTSALVRGLSTGEADRDADGNITVEELYQYLHDQVRKRTPNQRPHYWSFDVEGELVIARSPKPRPAELPPDVHAALTSEFPGARADAVRELERLLKGRHQGLALTATMELDRLKEEDDSLKVRSLAKSVLNANVSQEAPPREPRSDDVGLQQRTLLPSLFRTTPRRRRVAKPTTSRITIAKPQWVVGVSFLMLVSVGLAYGVLRNNGASPSSSAMPIGSIKEGGILSYAAEQEPTGLNNSTSRDNGFAVYDIVINMLPQAFHAQPDFTVKMDEAFLDSAEQISEDPQTIVYKIKQNAVWSDGTPISADDFIYLWEQLNGKIETNDVVSTSGYDQIESVTGSDKGKTVTVKFKNSYTDWKALFGIGGGLLPSHYIAKREGGWNTGLNKEPEKIPSGGPFKVQSWEKGLSLTLVRNDKYFGQKAHLDKIVFRFLRESITPAAALQNNQVDLIYPQPQLDQVAQVEALPDVTSHLNLGTTFEQFCLNFKNAFLADTAVRKAIASGINIGEIVNQTVKQFSDKAQPLGNRIWVNGQPHYQDHFGQYGKGDVAGAQKLLEGAGYIKGADGIYSKGGKRISLRFSTTDGQQAPRDSERAVPGPDEGDRGRDQDRQCRLAKVLR